MFQNQRYSNSISSGFMQKVYGWMGAGLACTAAISYYLSPEINPALFQSIVSYPYAMLGLFLAQLAVIVFMTWKAESLSYPVMGLLFMTFCALQGVAFAPILYVYTGSSVAYVFITACVMFAIMAIYGWATNADLSSMGNLLFMAMIGMLVAGIFNIFLHSSMLQMVISAVGVGVFSMLIAYDVQNLKKYSQFGVNSPEQIGKFALLGAVSLYLNLINLFFSLLQLFGEKRNK